MLYFSLNNACVEKHSCVCPSVAWPASEKICFRERERKRMQKFSYLLTSNQTKTTLIPIRIPIFIPIPILFLASSNLNLNSLNIELATYFMSYEACIVSTLSIFSGSCRFSSLESRIEH